MVPFPFMAGEEGFEPSQTESESVVLPLHNSPMLNHFITRELLCQYFFKNNFNLNFAFYIYIIDTYI